MGSDSILVIGASGRLGLEVARAAKKSARRFDVHAFVRSPSKISEQDKSLFTSIIQGDGLIASDIERALNQSKAKYVVHSIGVPNSAARTNLREKSAEALIDTIGPGGKLKNVSCIVISSYGAGGTKLNFGMGLGSCISFVIRHVLQDHDNREKLFTEQFSKHDGFRKRVLILRPTTLTLGDPKGNIRIFEDERPPTPWISREDLAKWIIDEVSAGGPSFGKALNVTGM